MRSLLAMGRARRIAQWDHTSQILCLLANVNRDQQKKPSPFHPDEFHPYRQRRSSGGLRLTRGDVPTIAKLFVEGNR